MSALRPHIRAARAYEKTCSAKVAEMQKANHSHIAIAPWRIQGEMHRRAAEIMEAEEAAEYAAPETGVVAYASDFPISATNHPGWVVTAYMPCAEAADHLSMETGHWPVCKMTALYCPRAGSGACVRKMEPESK